MKLIKITSIAGLVKIRDPLEDGLPPDINSTAGEDTRFALSVFHQLHCLQGLEMLLVRLKTGGSPSSSNIAHMDHCFDYLRQSITCAGDMTLESPDGVWSKGHEESTWKGTTHVCKSWGEITSWQAMHFSPMD
jgi:hypothetical protein